MEQEKVWDVVAGKWANCRVETPGEIWDFLDGRKGKVLDLGCGNGRNFVKKRGLKIYGIDFSEKMLKFAKKRTDKLKIDAKLIKSETDKIPFDDEFFDYGICFSVLHCVDSFEKRKKSVEELFRVLKSGAEAIVSIWGRGSPRVKNKDKESFVPWTVDGKKFLRYTYIYDKDELENLLTSAGFEIVKSWEDKNINVIVQKPTLS